MKKEKIICRDCGRIINEDELEDAYKIDGEYVCPECFEENYFYCDRCGKLECQEYGVYIEHDDIMVCDDCANNHYYHCEDCGCYFSERNGYYVEHYGYVCEHCFDRGDYGYCECCDNYFCRDDLNYSEYHDAYYCDDCYDESDDLLCDYHEFSDWQFFKAPNEQEPRYYIGKEIELEPKNYDNLQEVIDIMNRYINGVGMHDGSLNSGGIEVVTHPESWEYLQTKKQDYMDFFKNMESLGYGDAGNTGLHFHVSRPSDDIVARIIVILESFKEEIKKLSRRNGDFSWSRFLTDLKVENVEKYNFQSIKYLKEKYIKDYHDRYLALNLCNSNTIEFRFFNGANNFEEFWGALEFIHNIMEIAFDETKEINTINWQDLLIGDELREQARKQEVLSIKKNAKDTTEVVEKIEKAKEETKENIKRTLRNLIKYLTREIEGEKLSVSNINEISRITLEGRTFINKLARDLDYLQQLTDTYAYMESWSLKSIKERLESVQVSYDKSKDYTRYFKQIKEIYDKYEKEVYA